MTFQKRLASRLRRFRREGRGVAAVEFALIAPALILLLLGSTEVTHLIWANGRLNSTATAVGDLLTQERDMDDNVFRDVMDAVPLLMAPYQNASLSIKATSLITCCSPQAPGTPRYYVTWSRRWSPDGGVGAGAHATGVNRSQDMAGLVLPEGDTVILIEADYQYDSQQVLGWGEKRQFKKLVNYQPRNSRRIYYAGVEAQPYKNCAHFLSGS